MTELSKILDVPILQKRKDRDDIERLTADVRKILAKPAGTNRLEKSHHTTTPAPASESALEKAVRAQVAQMHTDAAARLAKVLTDGKHTSADYDSAVGTIPGEAIKLRDPRHAPRCTSPRLVNTNHQRRPRSTPRETRAGVPP